MKSIKTVGMLSVLLMAVCVFAAWLPARSAGSVILYVRNQPYTEPTIKEGSELYASLAGLLKAMRFGWKVEGDLVTILPSGQSGPALSAQAYSYIYRGRHVTIPTRIENGAPWVSVSGLARAVGAGFQTNSELNIAEIYFVPTSAPTSVATSTPAATASATPAAASSASPAVSASSSASPAASASSSASPDADASAAATPSPTPQPDVVVTHTQVTPQFSNGRLQCTVDVQNPADVPANSVNVHVQVLSGEGDEVFSQDVYIGTMSPHQTVTKVIDGAHPSGISMPHSLYRAETSVTFTR